MNLLVLTVLVFSLIGCAAHQQVWVKPDFNQSQFNSDVYRCQQDAVIYAQNARGTWSSHANQNIFLTGLFGEREVNYQFRFKECMQISGYQLEKR